MADALSRTPDVLTAELGKWDRIGRDHEVTLGRDGLAHFKRTLNVEYGQSAVVSMRGSQMRHLLRQAMGERVALRATLGAKFGPGGTPGALAANPWRRFVYRAFVGLVWALARARDRINCLDACAESLVGDPIDIRLGDRLITRDLAQSALEMNTIAACVPLAALERVAEIGAGYGRFAHAAMTLFPRLAYWIFDVPPALALSEAYLGVALGNDRVVGFDREARPGPGEVRIALPPALRDVPDGHFDLVVSTYSVDELPPRQIAEYLSLMDAKCRGWIYLKGGRHGTAGSAATLGLADLQYPRRWRRIFEGVDPLHPENVEYVFDLRG